MKAFIGHSFNIKNAELIQDLKEFIESEGIECISGEEAQNIPISQKVKQRIVECDLFIGIFTREKAIDSNPKEYTTSGWVMQEAGFAIGQNKNLIFLVENGIRKFPELQGDLEIIYFNRESLNKAYIKLSQMLKSVKNQNNSNKITTHDEVSDADKIAALEIKSKKYISNAGYKLLANNYGFDLCAEKTLILGPNEYIIIDFNIDKKVTASYVRDFLNKVTKFNDKLIRDTMWSNPILHSYIACFGELPKNVADLTLDFKPVIKFLKSTN